MGNNTSVPTDDSSDFYSIPYAPDPLQTGDGLNVPSSPTANYPLDSLARHELRLQLFKQSSHDLQDPSTSSLPTRLSANSTIMGKPDRVDISEALAVLQQFKQSASPQQLLELQNALLPTGSRTAPTSPNASQNEVVSPRPGQPDQLIRRKSYFTPGVATREKGNKLQKRPTSTRQPSSKSIEQHAWSPDMFGQSPLSKLAGWESKNDGLSERAITPDISQSYLGTYALGSLRVTNGVASPAPSVYSKLVSKTSQSSLKRHEDFYTASEGSDDVVADKGLEQSIAQFPGNATSAGLETTPMQEYVTRPKYGEGVLDFQEPTSYTAPLQSSSNTDPAVPSDISSNSPELDPSVDLLTRSPSVLKPYQHELNSNPFLDSTPNQEISQIEDTIESPTPSPYKTSPVLLYQNEANSNPFLATEEGDDIDDEPQSKIDLISRTEAQTQIPSFHDAFQDRFFQADSQDMRAPPASRSDFELQAAPRIEAFRRLNEQSNRHYEMFSAASSIYTAGSRRETKHPDLSSKKHDSGYGSEASRQNSKDTLVPQTVSAPCSTYPSPAEEKDDPTRASTETTIHTKSNYAPPLKSALSSKYREQVDVTKPLPQTPPAASSSNPIEVAQPSLRPQSTPNLLLLSSPASDLSTNVQKPASGPRKLQKKRPRSQKMNSEPLIVQTQPIIENPGTKLPQIPAHISERHAERLNQQPKMDHLERTYKSVTHEKSHESFHSSEPYNVPIRFPSPTRGAESLEGKERRPNYRRSSFTPEHLQSFFRRGERSKSGSHARPQENTNMDIADFGTVTGSLGSSPYDLAYPTGHHERRGRAPALGASRHPHQMGYHESITKSTTGMTDAMASQFAQRRSRDRHERAYGIAQSEQRPKQRSKSSSENHSQLGSSSTHRDRSAPAKGDDHRLRRPKSWYATSASEIEHDKVHEKRAYPVADVDSESLPTRQSEYAAPVSNPAAGAEQEVDWGASARAWRLRRKSLGENLRSHAAQDSSKPEFDNARSPSRRPQTPHQQPSSPSYRSSRRPVPVYAATAAQSQARESLPAKPLEKQGQRSRAEEASEPPRASSPTPSVRERAAAYERGIQAPSSPDRQSPTRRPPSPLKSSAYNIRTAEQLPPMRSKFSMAPQPHSAASPSGVASAYTVSENASPMGARDPEKVPTLFQRPVDLSPPKRRGTNITRRPVGALAASPGH